MAPGHWADGEVGLRGGSCVLQMKLPGMIKRILLVQEEGISPELKLTLQGHVHCPGHQRPRVGQEGGFPVCCWGEEGCGVQRAVLLSLPLALS